MNQIVIGTAGHIDHGKTSLVKSLTGMETDSLVEEKKRGMTIDLGFAYLNDNITIIDVPGHEKFIRNMASGAANIHYGLIVIAADDGIMPQTIEHIDILNILGVKKGWVAITKVDVINDKEWIELIANKLNKEPKFQLLPSLMFTLLSPFVSMIKEVREMNYQFTNEYIINSDKIEKELGIKPTKYEDGIDEIIKLG